MKRTNKASPPPSDEYDFADITGVYLAATRGDTRIAAFMLWKWASLVALGAMAFYVVTHFVVKYW